MCRRFNSYQHHVKDRLHGLSFFVPGPRYHYLFWSFSHHARPARESYQPHQPRPFPRPSRPSLPLLVSPIMPTHARILPATPAAPCAASQAPEAARYRAAGSLGLRPGYGGGRRHFSGTSKPLRKVAIAQAEPLPRARRSAISRFFLPCRFRTVLTTPPQGGGRTVWGCFRAYHRSAKGW